MFAAMLLVTTGDLRGGRRSAGIFDRDALGLFDGLLIVCGRPGDIRHLGSQHPGVPV